MGDMPYLHVFSGQNVAYVVDMQYVVEVVLVVGQQQDEAYVAYIRLLLALITSAILS